MVGSLYIEAQKTFCRWFVGIDSEENSVGSCYTVNGEVPVLAANSHSSSMSPGRGAMRGLPLIARVGPCCSVT